MHEPGLLGQLDAALELLAPLEPAASELDSPEAVEREHERLGVADSLGQRDRPRPPISGRVRVVEMHRDLGQLGVRARELGSRRRLLEQPHCLKRDRPGLETTAGAEEQRRPPAQRVALLDDIVTRLVDRQLFLQGVERRRAHVGEKALVREPLEQPRPRVRRQPLANRNARAY